MNVSKVLVPVSWTLWDALLLVLLWSFARVLTEQSHSPDAAPAVGAVVMGLLLKHGAIPNARDPQSGMTAMAGAGDRPDLVPLLVEAGASVDERLPGGESMLVSCAGLRQSDSVLYLIEKGAMLDVTNPRGLSLDYDLKDWKESVNGGHPEGWDRVRAAILSRRRS